jgi:tRNA (guanine-N7-)-methyltransferase
MRLSTRRLLLDSAERRYEITLDGLAATGGWSGVFGSDGALSLEIGIGKDTHLLERAARAPGGRFVGVEYTRKKVDKAISKFARGIASEPHAEGSVPENLRVLFADIGRVLEAAFAPESLERAWILFPDPWPKVRHHRRRIVNPSFIDRLCARLRPGARLEVRTDDAEYRDQIAAVLAAEPRLRNLAAPLPFLLEPLDPADHVPTLFEMKFKARGLPLHHFYFERRPG